MKVSKRLESKEVYSGATVELNTLEVAVLKDVLADYISRNHSSYNMRRYVASLLLGSLNHIKDK